MRRILLLSTLALFLCACANSGSGGPVPAHLDFKLSEKPVFLIAGQSNGVSPAQEHPWHYSSTGRVLINDYYGDKQMRVPTPERPMQGGVSWIYLGDMLNRDVTFVNIAIGSQSTEKWRLYHLPQQMVPQLQSQRFDAVLWVQGESDWGEQFSEEQTYQNMRYMIEESRRVQPDLVWFVALNSYKTTPKENHVRRAQRRLIDEGIVLPGPDTDTLRENPAWVESGFGEFVGQGLKEHARLWYQVLKRY